MEKQEGIILCGHGSRSEKGTAYFIRLFEKFSQLHPELEIGYAFLEIQQPGFQETLVKLVEKGIKRIVVVPVFLFSGVHVCYDIPYEFKQLAKEFPQLEIKMADRIGCSPLLVNLIMKRLDVAINRETLSIHKNTKVILAGVGSSEPYGGKDIEKLTNRLKTELNFEHIHHSFLNPELTPTFPEALNKLCSQTNEKIVILPLLLFPGFYLRQIRKEIENQIQKKAVHIVCADILGDDLLIMEALEEQMNKARRGDVDLLGNIAPDMQARREF